MTESLDLDDAGFDLELEPFTIDLTVDFDLELELVPINLDCLEYQPADTGGANEPV